MSGAKVNIPSYIQDPYYRYKMPKMVLKQESRLNGVKTNIFNLDEVAKALRVPEEAIIKYWCAELGASKEKKTILKGQHNYDTLLKFLDKFIEKYILCNKCKYPETSLFIKNKTLQSRCRACGTINVLDGNHRAGSYLMKQLPANMSEIEEQNTQGNEKQKKKPATDEAIEEEKNGDEIKEDEAVNLESEEILEAINKINTMVKDNATNDKLIEEVKKLVVSLGLGGEFKYYILICGLFPPERNIVKNWKNNEDAFLAFVQADGKIGIRHLMQSIIQLFIRKHSSLGVYAGTFMKLMYDQEVFEEEFIIKWFNKKLKLDKTCALYDRKAERLFRKSIAQFVDWLVNAQEEEEDGEEEEEEEEEEEQKVPEKQKSAPKQSEETEAMRAQKELILKQMQEQQQMMKDAAAKTATQQANATAELTDKVNVLDINVEDDFEIDDI